MNTHPSDTIWSVSEAKSRLSEVLRRARKRGPQYIGKREQCVVISKEEWEAHSEPMESMSVWLLNHRPNAELQLPRRGENNRRPNPFEQS